MTNLRSRTALAGIQPLGEHPCVRCTVPKKLIYRLGKKSDMRTRRIARRMENVLTRTKRARAAALVYNQRKKLNAREVKAELQDNSLVAVVVSVLSLLKRLAPYVW